MPSFPARPLNPVITNSRTISKTVIQISTLPIKVKPMNMKVIKILSAIVSKNAPVLDVTFHFRASLPSKKSVQAAMNAMTAGTSIRPVDEPSSRIK